MYFELVKNVRLDAPLGFTPTRTCDATFCDASYEMAVSSSVLPSGETTGDTSSIGSFVIRERPSAPAPADRRGRGGAGGFAFVVTVVPVEGGG